jgi:hypothetical protein
MVCRLINPRIIDLQLFHQPTPKVPGWP